MMLLLSAVTAALFLTNYRGMVRYYNTTMLALSYQYGFTSRSLLGTLYHLLDAVLPVDLISYRCVVIVATVCTLAFFAFLLWFCYVCLKKCSMESIRFVEYLLLLLVIALDSTFSFAYNFFRVDLFMIWTVLIAVLCMLKEQSAWIAVPLSAVGVMFHQGFVLMYFNLILVFLFYLIFTRRDHKKKYTVLFLLSFGIGSALFLWFELFSRSNGAAVYDRVAAEAEKLSWHGIYHEPLLYHEVLGIDISDSETMFYHMNHVQLLLFVLCTLPFLVYGISFFVRLIRRGEGVLNKLKYLAAAVGAATILPDLLLKVDYGRWMLSVCVYYLGILLILFLMHDPAAEQIAHSDMARFQTKPWLFALLLIPVLLVPFLDVDIDSFTQSLQCWFQNNQLLFY